MSDEIDEIRRKRLEELQNQNQSEQVRYQQEQEAVARAKQKEMILRSILTDDAKQRLSNLKLVKKDMAEDIENQLIRLYQSGRLQSQINETQLLQMLKQLQGNKRESSIKFKRV